MLVVSVLRRVRDALAGCAVLAWLGWGGLVMSWAGHRPLAPDRDHPFPYQNHGTMYVSSSDLQTSHVLLDLTLAFLLPTILVTVIGQNVYSEFEDGLIKRSLARVPPWRTLTFAIGVTIMVGFALCLGNLGR